MLPGSMHENDIPPPTKEAARTTTPLSSWAALLEELPALAHLAPVVAEEDFLESTEEAATSRVEFLARLKALGVKSLNERQKLANACSQAHKLGRTVAPPVVVDVSEEAASSAAGARM